MPIYIETMIRSRLEDVWHHTQDPALHQRWDLRFTSIEYLERASADAPQRFTYSTRVGFGITVAGEGESTGDADADDARVSALRFWSADPKSLITHGSGFWKYVEEDGVVAFKTVYDYRVRGGPLGRWFDRLVFRPAMAWATAWSFDRLRLWLEKGVSPERAAAAAIVYGVSRVALAVIWVYQGVVPKLVFPDAGELAIVRGSAFFAGNELAVLRVLGGAEILFGIAHVAFWRSTVLSAMNIPLLAGLLLVGAVSQPSILTTPFNAVTLTIAMTALTLICTLTMADVPSSLNARWSSRRVL